MGGGILTFKISVEAVDGGFVYSCDKTYEELMTAIYDNDEPVIGSSPTGSNFAWMDNEYNITLVTDMWTYTIHDDNTVTRSTDEQA